VSDLEPDWPDAGQEELARVTSVEAHERRGTRGVRRHRRQLSERPSLEQQDADIYSWAGKFAGFHDESLEAYVDARLDGLNHSQAYVEAMRFYTTEKSPDVGFEDWEIQQRKKDRERELADIRSQRPYQEK
jgi:hypothetical protein